MIDEDGDDRMDDLNGDGKVDQRDALVIAEAVRRLELSGKVRPGGIGVYAMDDPEAVGAYVHFDARGYMTRWGSVWRNGHKRDLDWWPPAEFKQDANDE
jgi:hypothetical protein